MKLTLPQVIMLNHAADVNKKRADERQEVKRNQDQKEEEDPVVFLGKKASELSQDEFSLYVGTDDSMTVRRVG
jgi:hypothetical protein